MNIDDLFHLTIEHPRFSESLERLLQFVRIRTSTKIIIVPGPTGAGKSTLMKWLIRALEHEFVNELSKDTQRLAYAYYTVKAPGQTAFSWRDCYIELLKSLQHPFADAGSVLNRKSGAPHEADLAPMTASQAHRVSNDRLFRIVQKTTLHRRPKAILVDEAQHLLRVSSQQSLLSQLEHLKYLADETQTLHILFGTYELIKLMDLSGALTRRREVVHFPRYIYDQATGQSSIEEFAFVVKQYSRHLGAACEVEMLKEVPFLYQGCVGCVGVLRDWLVRAAYANRSKTITKASLEATVMAASDRRRLLDEALDGEAYFARRAACEGDYLGKLGFADEPPSPPPSAPRGRPFRRKPHNDSVGPTSLNPNDES